MRKIIINLCIILVVVISFVLMGIHIRNLNNELSITANNVKAYALENSDLKKKNIVFEMSIATLHYSNDSLLREMKRIANENGIKDKKIKSLQYQLEHYNKVDTIIVRDTIFKNPTFHLDTCIVDKWNKVCLSLSYPGNIGIRNTYYNNKYIIVDTHKEPIKERKCSIARWFTKKHIVAEITVIDENPYVSTPRQRFVEIIK